MDEVIVETVGGFSFPSPAISLKVEDDSDPFRPVFGWNLSGSADYSAWVKEYRFYLDGAYKGYTEDTEFTLSSPLTPEQTYVWYVMPIHHDGTAFFSSPEPGSYKVPAHTAPDVFIDEPANNSTLIVGETYTFSGSSKLYNGAEEASADWTIGTVSVSGMEADFTPSQRFAANSLTANLSVTDSFGLSNISAPLNITVLDPAIALQGVTSRTVDTDTDITFSLNTANTYDIVAYEWFVDGDSVGSGNSLIYSFPNSGIFLVDAAGTSDPDMNGNTKTVQSESVTITAVGEGPTVLITSPDPGSEIMEGSLINIETDITAGNGLKSTTWEVTGPDALQNGTTGDTFIFNPDQSGEYTLTVVVEDNADKVAQASIRVLVNEALVEITNITANANYPLNSEITPEINAPNASRLSLYIDGTEISGSTLDLSDFGTGSHTVHAVAFWNTIDSASLESAPIQFNVVDLIPPNVSIDFPSDDMVWKTGETYSLDGSVESDSTISESWWEIDGEILSSNSFTPAAGSKKLITVSYHARNVDSVEGSSSLAVRVADPSVYSSEPDDFTVLQGSTVLINASAVDADLFWLLDDVEIDEWDKTFQDTGVHTLQAGWRVEAVNSFGSTEDFTGLTDVMTFTVYTDVPPVILKSIPNNQFIRNAIGVNLTFQVDPSSGNALQDTRWEIRNNGTVLKELDGDIAVHSFGEAGQYTVLAEIRDDYGFSVSREWTVKIINPSIAITSPVEGTINKLGVVPVPTVAANELASYYFKLDGVQTESSDFADLVVGSYQLTAVGEYFVTGNSDPVEISSSTINFQVADLTPPNFSLEGIKGGDRVIAGLQYHFAASHTSSETFEWVKNGAVIGTGASLNFTPEAEDGVILFVLRSKMNGISVDMPFTVEVIDPFFSITLPETSQKINGYDAYPAGTPIPLKYEARDIDRVEWRLDTDLTPYSGGASVTFSSGLHSINAVAFATNVRLQDASYGNFETIEGISGRDIQIAENITVESVVTDSPIYTGNPLSITVTTSGNDDFYSSSAFSVDGVIYSETTEKSIAINGLNPGTHKISVITTDVFGNTSQGETTVTVYDPLMIEISRPANGARVSPDSEILASVDVKSGQYTAVKWIIDGADIKNSNFISGSLGKLKPGEHTLTVTVTDHKNNSVTADVSIEVQSDFQLNLLSPVAGTEIIIGNSVVCRVGVKKVAGSSINLSDAAQYISWYVAGSDTGETGLTFTYTGINTGTESIYAQYEKDGMVRRTAENSIMVNALIDPVITTPVNGSTITYSLGNKVLLKATGEPGAIFTWLLGNSVVAVGKETSFNPNGLIGRQQLKLQMRAQGQTKEITSTVTFALNTPPELTLSAPKLQFTGDELAWTAIASDVEDQNPGQVILYFLDGVPLEAGRLLSDADIGQHTLGARTTDSNGISVSKQVAVKVESSNLNLQIQSPEAGDTYFKNYAVPLKAILENSGSGVSDTFKWIVEYLDNPGQASEEIIGNNIDFLPAALGEIAVTSKFVDTNGRERGLKRISFKVENEPLSLGIYWPHGMVVNSGQDLYPELIGAPEGVTGETNWSMNGATIPDITTVTAPAIAGKYTLSVQYSQDGTSYTRAKVDFTVNEVPEIVISSPENEGQYVFGTPLILAATVEDDQTYEGTIIWKMSDGTDLGEGNPLVLENLAVGDWQIIGEGEDRYGATASGTTSIKIYEPLTNVKTTINDGLTTFLISDITQIPMKAKLEYTGGIAIAPIITWKLLYEDSSLVKTGNEVNFTYEELRELSLSSAILTVEIIDTGLTDETAQKVFSKEFPLIFTSGSGLVELVAPTVEDLFYANESVPMTVALTGFTLPDISITIDGEEVVSSWLNIEGTSLFSAEIAGSNFPAEGIYELLISVDEGTVTKAVPYTLNIYNRRVGIFVDDAPAEINLENETGSVTAVTAGLGENGFDKIQWRTDISVEPVGEGTTLNLSEAGLLPGERSISVEALLGETIVAQNTFPIKVVGPMTITLTPDEEKIIAMKGADVSIFVEARDSDGSVIPEEKINWISHIDGLLETGNELALGTLTEISIGEHIITIQAEGSNGDIVSILKSIQINSPPETAETDNVPPDQPGGDSPPPTHPQENLARGVQIQLIMEVEEPLPPAWMEAFRDQLTRALGFDQDRIQITVNSVPTD